MGLGLGRRDARRDLAERALGLGRALEVARGVGLGVERGIERNLERAGGLVRVGQRHRAGARRYLAQVGEQRLAEAAQQRGALGICEVAI